MRRHTSTLRLAHGLNISNKEALAMAWKLYKSYRDGVCEIREYLCDTASDIANLPSDTGNGSLAYLVAEKKTQICNGGIWHDYLPYQVSKRDIDELDTKINAVEEETLNAKEITASALKALKDAGMLIQGRQYRVIDYAPTWSGSNFKMAGHQFDIVVIADSASVLNEACRFIKHDGDAYFAGCNLSAWQGRVKFEDVTVRGVVVANYYIDWMKDEFGNECPYDFKNVLYTGYIGHSQWGPTYIVGRNSALDVVIDNVQYYGYSCDSTPSAWSSRDFYVTDSSISSASVMYSIQNNVASVLSYGGKLLFVLAPGQDYYTCSSSVFADSSLLAESNVRSNKIVWKESSIKYPWIVFVGNSCSFNAFGNYCHDNTFGNSCYFNAFGNNCYSNTFGNNCSSNTFGTDCHDNSFGTDCHSNVFGNNYYSNTFCSSSSSNTFGTDCHSNAFGNYYYSNTFGNSCSSNTFGTGCNSNTFGNSCSSNNFGNSCNSNTFGNYFRSNTFGNDCYYNTFGNSCQYNTFGNSCQSNTFGNSCQSNTFGNSCQSNTFGNSCDYLKISDSSSTLKQYIRVDCGLRGASDANKFDLYDPAILNKNYQVTFRNSASGKYLMLWANNNGAMTGKIKATNTTPTWSDIV